jgi:hypothetical protein
LSIPAVCAATSDAAGCNGTDAHTRELIDLIEVPDVFFHVGPRCRGAQHRTGAAGAARGERQRHRHLAMATGEKVMSDEGHRYPWIDDPDEDLPEMTPEESKRAGRNVMKRMREEKAEEQTEKAKKKAEEELYRRNPAAYARMCVEQMWSKGIRRPLPGGPPVMAPDGEFYVYHPHAGGLYHRVLKGR